MKIFEMKLSDIQPSQLYISKKKLDEVNKWLNNENNYQYDPIPIKKLNGRIIYTDGHTRAQALYDMGFDTVQVYFDEDDLSWDAYQVCVDWCLEANINSIKDLSSRKVSEAEYDILWHQRCDKLHEDLGIE